MAGLCGLGAAASLRGDAEEHEQVMAGARPGGSVGSRTGASAAFRCEGGRKALVVIEL